MNSKYTKVLLFLILMFGILSINDRSTQASVVNGVEDHFNEDSQLWDYLGSASRANGAVTLTPSNQSEAGVIWLKEPVSPPYDVSFRMRMSGHHDWYGSEVPADGIVFMFNKNKSTTMMNASHLGFEAGNGYGVEFDTYYNNDPGQTWDYVGGQHISLFRNNANQVEDIYEQVQSPSNMTNGEWHHVKIKVRDDSVQVYLDDVIYMNKSLILDPAFNYLGFSASTGHYFSTQEIDDVVITKPSSIQKVFTASSSPIGMQTGDELTFTVQFDQPVSIDELDPPRLQMNSSVESYADYESGNHTDQLVFKYIAREWDQTPYLNYIQYTWLGAISYRDEPNSVTTELPPVYSPDSLAGTPIHVNMNQAPAVIEILHVSGGVSNMAYKAGDTISINVTFSDAVQVTGTPLLYLNTGRPAEYNSGSGTEILTFTYQVDHNDQIKGLNYWTIAALHMNSGTYIEPIDAVDEREVSTALPLLSSSSSLLNQSYMILDQTVPELFIEKLPPSGTLGEVKLQLSAADLEGLTGAMMRFYVDSDYYYEAESLPGWTDWIPYTADHTLLLPSSTHSAQIQAQVKDLAGNISEVSDAVILQPPVAAHNLALLLGTEVFIPPNESTALSADSTTAGDYTISMWVNPASDSNYQNLFYQGDTLGAPSRELRLVPSYQYEQSNRVGIQFNSWGSTTDYSGYYDLYFESLNTIPVHEWTHLALVQHNGRISLYINGVKDAPEVTPSISNNDPSSFITKSTMPMILGGYFGGEGFIPQDSLDSYYVGMDDFQIWHQALLFEEDPNLLELLFHDPVPGSPYFDQLASHYTMDKIADYRVFDSVNGNYGLFYGEVDSFLPRESSLLLHHLQGEPLTGRLLSFDPNEDDVTYHLSVLPTNGTVTLDPATGEFQYVSTTPTIGTDSFLYYVSDGILHSNISTVTIITDPLEQAPEIVSIDTEPTSDIPTNAYNITVKVGASGYPTLTQWMSGQKSAVDFDDHSGLLVTDSQFDVYSNGWYTIYTENAFGHDIEQIYISHFDRDAPEISLSGPIQMSIWQNSLFSDPGYTATDTYPGFTPAVVVTGEVDPSTPGEYELTYTATDRAGNISKAVRTVNVVPRSNNADLMELLLDGNALEDFSPSKVDYSVNVSYETVSAALSWTVSDAVYGQATLSGPTELIVGENDYIITVTAHNGTVKPYKVTINRADLIAPVLTNIAQTPSNDTPTNGNVTVSATVHGEHITTFKWLRGNVGEEAFATGGELLLGTDGSFQVTENDVYTLFVQNVRGGYDLKTVSVQNIDRNAPVINLNGPNSLVLFKGAAYDEPGYTLEDNWDTVAQLTVAIQGNVDTNVEGSYSLTYTVTDRAGNSSSVQRMITIVRPLSSNADLSLISPQGYALNFDQNVTVYSMQVPYEITSLPISYSIADSSASVTVTGSVYQSEANAVYTDLQVGPNRVHWLVKAEDNSTKLYTLTITRASSTNAYIEQFSLPNSDITLSAPFDSKTNNYDLYLTSTSNPYIGVLHLSDPQASFTVTGVTYTVTGSTYTSTVTGVTYNPSYILFDFGNSTSFDITVLAADQSTQNTYHFNLHRVPIARPIQYAKMLDAKTLQIRFQAGITADNLLLLDHIVLNGLPPVTITNLHSVNTGAQTLELELELSQAVNPDSIFTLSILPGLLQSEPEHSPVMQFNSPVMNLNAIQNLHDQLDTHNDGLYINDILKGISMNEDYNGDGAFDKNDLLFLLSLIGRKS